MRKRVIFGAIGLIFFCSFLGSDVFAESVKVAVSILPIADFVENIGKDKVMVTVMVTAGRDPHTYEPTPAQMREVSRSDLYVKAGSGIEFERMWMDKIASLNKKMYICDSSRGIKLIDLKESSKGQGKHRHRNLSDPHIWLSPLNAVLMVSNIRDSLILIDPENEAFYKKNAQEYILKLTKLNHWIKSKLSTVKNRYFMVFHSGWGYFCIDYDLEEIPVLYGSGNISPGKIAGLIKKAKRLDIKVIFISPQFSRRSSDIIAKEIGGRVELIDPLAKDYIVNLEEVVDLFVESR